MSNVSVTSSKHEKNIEGLTQELESLRELTSSLRSYLKYIKQFKRNLTAYNDDFKQLGKVNEQWIKTVKIMKYSDK